MQVCNGRRGASTVDTCAQCIKAKLGGRTVVETVSLARDNGLI